MCRINQRSAPVLRALETAASVDADAKEVRDRFQQQRRIGLNEFASALSRKTDRVRHDEGTITDTLWMLTLDAYLRLVQDAGWPALPPPKYSGEGVLRQGPCRDPDFSALPREAKGWT